MRQDLPRILFVAAVAISCALAESTAAGRTFEVPKGLDPLAVAHLRRIAVLRAQQAGRRVISEQDLRGVIADLAVVAPPGSATRSMPGQNLWTTAVKSLRRVALRRARQAGRKKVSAEDMRGVADAVASGNDPIPDPPAVQKTPEAPSPAQRPAKTSSAVVPMPSNIDSRDGEHLFSRLVQANSLLRTGRDRQAIDILRKTEESLSRNDDFRFLHFEVLSKLGIAHLRTGSQSACRRLKQSSSCLFPGNVQDLRVDPKDAEEAIRIFERLLDLKPMDLSSLWLLNLAYMGAGKYPGKVPRQWLIPPQAFKSEYPLGRFKDAAPKLGLDVLGHAGGSIIEDFDGDGYLDIMASSVGRYDQLRFFRNKGDGTFEDRTEKAGLKGIGGGLHIVQTDYDNDGRPDVFILRPDDGGEGYPGGYNVLLRNKGGGRFEDVTEKAGLAGASPASVAVWADFDNDGWIDLFLGNDDMGGRYQPSLWRNDGDGTFTNVTRDADIDVSGFVIGANWGDFDNDGRIDLYLSIHGKDNVLYRNAGPDREGRWRFVDVTAKAGVAGPSEGFSTWFWDFNNDGWEDIFIFDFPRTLPAETAAADYSGLGSGSHPPRLYRNRGDGTFEEVSRKMGLTNFIMSRGANFGDLDMDGWLDFYAGTGNMDLRSIIPNQAYRNKDGAAFQDVTASGGLGLLQKGHGVSFGDIDNDGDQDIYIVMGAAYEDDVARNALFINPGNANHWVTLLLEGTKSNRAAIGARIKLRARVGGGTREIHRTVTTGGSFGANSFQVEIGLGRATAIESIEILWPATGKRQVLERPPMDRSIRILEGTPGYRLVERKRLSLLP